MFNADPNSILHSEQFKVLLTIITKPTAENQRQINADHSALPDLEPDMNGDCTMFTTTAPLSDTS